MREYLHNCLLWVTGWRKLGTLEFKQGWTAWGWKPFWFPYATTYLAGTLAGAGVVSLSRFWYERSKVMDGNERAYPFAHLMTRLLDWLVPGKHGANAGGLLWGSTCLRKMT